MIVRVALLLNGTSNAQLIIDGKRYLINIKANPGVFISADIIAHVAVTETDMSVFEAMMNAPTSDIRSDNISAARKVLERSLIILGSHVEIAANNPAIPDTERDGIIHMAGMQVRGKSLPKKREFTVENSDVEGAVILTAKGGAKAHEWQYTTDMDNLDNNRTAAKATTASTTRISGLKRGVKHAFFHKAVLSKGEDNGWDGPRFIIVS